jgi:hypothetical protein
MWTKEIKIFKNKISKQVDLLIHQNYKLIRMLINKNKTSFKLEIKVIE